MDDHEVETHVHRGMTITIYHDQDAESPRDWDNFGEMYCVINRDYVLGDHQVNLEHYDSWEQIVEEMVADHGATVVLPLDVHDNWQPSMSIGQVPDDLWGDRIEGWVCDDKAKRKELGFTERDHFGRNGLCDEFVVQLLKGEVETYSRYMSGEVYGYVVTDEDGIDYGSCWGFYGTEDALHEARAEADYAADKVKEALDVRMAEEAEASVTYAWNG